MNTDITKALINYQQLLRRQAKDLLAPAALALAQAKANHHDCLIRSKQLNKLADEVEKLVSVTEMAAYIEAKQVESDYSVHSYSDMANLVTEKDASE